MRTVIWTTPKATHARRRPHAAATAHAHGPGTLRARTHGPQEPQGNDAQNASARRRRQGGGACAMLCVLDGHVEGLPPSGGIAPLPSIARKPGRSWGTVWAPASGRRAMLRAGRENCADADHVELFLSGRGIACAMGCFPQAAGPPTDSRHKHKCSAYRLCTLITPPILGQEPRTTPSSPGYHAGRPPTCPGSRSGSLHRAHGLPHTQSMVIFSRVPRVRPAPPDAEIGAQKDVRGAVLVFLGSAGGGGDPGSAAECYLRGAEVLRVTAPSRQWRWGVPAGSVNGSVRWLQRHGGRGSGGEVYVL
ncbi:predicted protein [Postia placenta Mad-698-R]|uniref:Uncharacterized protein n=1 Tax=Postia placenta MAD-698-R-SB12 TaxID=670580 RepID=A0A1X6MTM6_9APHY|nr:hypothetical protein POSPLADRAFT_1149456 [Postia placenta MAD-698-R-SB12]EED79434.1 predicted protein [Postia placenta Mad-698-R]OSX59679.1 hypothetical protein POSPLADRAFT_1149456 [Postia placenta MAD-698-R-SB12]